MNRDHELLHIAALPVDKAERLSVLLNLEPRSHLANMDEYPLRIESVSASEVFVTCTSVYRVGKACPVRGWIMKDYKGFILVLVVSRGFSEFPQCHSIRVLGVPAIVPIARYSMESPGSSTLGNSFWVFQIEQPFQFWFGCSNSGDRYGARSFQVDSEQFSYSCPL